jgi:hypothetical protein
MSEAEPNAALPVPLRGGTADLSVGDPRNKVAERRSSISPCFTCRVVCLPYGL